MSLFMTALKEGDQLNMSVPTVYELVSYYKFVTSTVAPNKWLMRLFATAPYLKIEKMCSAAYFTLDLDS